MGPAPGPVNSGMGVDDRGAEHHVRRARRFASDASCIQCNRINDYND